MKKGPRHGSLTKAEEVRQKSNEEASEFLGRVCKASRQYRCRPEAPKNSKVVSVILIGQSGP